MPSSTMETREVVLPLSNCKLMIFSGGPTFCILDWSFQPFYNVDHFKWCATFRTTDKRTDVWSRDFMIWKINSGLWAEVWAGLWNKSVWADCEQLLRPVFSLSWGQKKNLKYFFWIFFCPEKVKSKFFRVKYLSVNTWRSDSGPDICSLICVLYCKLTCLLCRFVFVLID